MHRSKLKMAIGNWVDGERFWGRESDLEIFIARIEAGAHQLLSAQRRMGKTSLMKETARRLQNRYLCLFVDLQKCSTAADAVVEMSLAVRPHRTVWGKLGGIFTGLAGRFREDVEQVSLGEIGISLRADLVGEWQRKGDQLFERAGRR